MADCLHVRDVGPARQGAAAQAHAQQGTGAVQVLAVSAGPSSSVVFLVCARSTAPQDGSPVVVLSTDLQVFESKAGTAEAAAAQLATAEGSGGSADHTQTSDDGATAAACPGATVQQLARLYVEAVRLETDPALAQAVSSRRQGESLLAAGDGREALRCFLQAQLGVRQRLGELSRTHMQLVLLVGDAFLSCSRPQQATSTWDRVLELALKRQATAGREAPLAAVVRDAVLRLAPALLHGGEVAKAVDVCLVALNRTADCLQHRSLALLVLCEDVLRQSAEPEDAEQSSELRAAALERCTADSSGSGTPPATPLQRVRVGAALVAAGQREAGQPLIDAGLPDVDVAGPDWAGLTAAVARLAQAGCGPQCVALVARLEAEHGMAGVPLRHRGALYLAWCEAAVGTEAKADIVARLRLCAKSYTGSSVPAATMRARLLLRVRAALLAGTEGERLDALQRQELLTACHIAFQALAQLDATARLPAVDRLQVECLCAFGGALMLNGESAFAKGAFIRALGFTLSPHADPDGQRRPEILAALAKLKDAEAASLDDYPATPSSG